MQAFQTALKPSRAGCIFTVLLHLAAALFCLLFFYGAARWLGLSLLAASLVWAWRVQTLRGRAAVHKIAVDRQGRAAVFTGAEHTAFAATLMPKSLISRHVLFLQWDIGGRIFYHCVLPDMTERESYRRLMVWAKWGRPKD